MADTKVSIPLEAESESLAQAAERSRALGKELTTLSSQINKVGTATKSLAYIAGGLGAVSFEKLVQKSVLYNKTLYDLSKQASVTGQDFGKMQKAISELNSSTSLSRKESAEFYNTLNTGMRAMKASGELTIKLGKALTHEFGPGLEHIKKATQDLMAVQQKDIHVLERLNQGMNPKAAVAYISAMEDLRGVSEDQAETFLRTARAMGEKGKEETAEEKRLIALTAAQQKFKKIVEDVQIDWADKLQTVLPVIYDVLGSISNVLKSMNPNTLKLLLGVTVAGGGILAVGKTIGAIGSMATLFKGKGPAGGAAAEAAAATAAKSMGAGGGAVPGHCTPVCTPSGRGLATTQSPQEVDKNAKVAAKYNKTAYQQSLLGKGHAMVGSGYETFRGPVDPETGKRPGLGSRIGATGRAAAGFLQENSMMVGMVATAVGEGIAMYGSTMKETNLAGREQTTTGGKMLGLGGGMMSGAGMGLMMGGPLGAVGGAALGALGPLADLAGASDAAADAADTLTDAFGQTADATLGFFDKAGITFKEAGQYWKDAITKPSGYGLLGDVAMGTQGGVGAQNDAKNLMQDRAFKKRMEKSGQTGTFSEMEADKDRVGIARQMQLETRKEKTIKDRYGVHDQQGVMAKTYLEESGKQIAEEIANEKKLTGVKRTAFITTQAREFAATAGTNKADPNSQMNIRFAEKQKDPKWMAAMKGKLQKDDFSTAGRPAEVSEQLEKVFKEQAKVTSEAYNTRMQYQGAKADLENIQSMVEAANAANAALAENALKYENNTAKASVLLEKNLANIMQERVYIDAVIKLKEKINREGKENVLIQEEADKITASTGVKLNAQEVAELSLQTLQGKMAKSINDEFDTRQKLTQVFKEQTAVADSEISKLEAEADLTSQLFLGMAPAIDAQNKVIDAIEKKIGLIDKEIELQEKQIRDGKATQYTAQRLNELQAQRTGMVAKELNITKSLREGYLDAMGAFTNVTGSFSKIVAKQDVAVGVMIDRFRAISTMRFGGEGGFESPFLKFGKNGSVMIGPEEDSQRMIERRTGSSKFGEILGKGLAKRSSQASAMGMLGHGQESELGAGGAQALGLRGEMDKRGGEGAAARAGVFGDIPGADQALSDQAKTEWPDIIAAGIDKSEFAKRGGGIGGSGGAPGAGGRVGAPGVGDKGGGAPGVGGKGGGAPGVGGGLFEKGDEKAFEEFFGKIDAAGAAGVVGGTGAAGAGGGWDPLKEYRDILTPEQLKDIQKGVDPSKIKLTPDQIEKAKNMGTTGAAVTGIDEPIGGGDLGGWGGSNAVDKQAIGASGMATDVLGKDSATTEREKLVAEMQESKKNNEEDKKKGEEEKKKKKNVIYTKRELAYMSGGPGKRGIPGVDATPTEDSEAQVYAAYKKEERAKDLQGQLAREGGSVEKYNSVFRPGMMGENGEELAGPSKDKGSISYDAPASSKSNPNEMFLSKNMMYDPTKGADFLKENKDAIQGLTDSMAQGQKVVQDYADTHVKGINVLDLVDTATKSHSDQERLIAQHMADAAMTNKDLIKSSKDVAKAMKDAAVNAKLAAVFNDEQDAVDVEGMNEAMESVENDTPQDEGGFATGGFVPGVGNKDSMPAMLTPGEFVMNKASTQKHSWLLKALNANRFATGGLVGGSLVGPAPSADTSGASINPKIAINIKGDSVSKIMKTATSQLYTQLNRMLVPQGTSGRQFDQTSTT